MHTKTKIAIRGDGKCSDQTAFLNLVYFNRYISENRIRCTVNNFIFAYSFIFLFFFFFIPRHIIVAGYYGVALVVRPSVFRFRMIT